MISTNLESMKETTLQEKESLAQSHWVYFMLYSSSIPIIIELGGRYVNYNWIGMKYFEEKTKQLTLYCCRLTLVSKSYLIRQRETSILNRTLWDRKPFAPILSR